MNKTVRSLILLHRCYGDAVPAADLLDLFKEGTDDINTQRRTLRRYLADFEDAGIRAEWLGRGAKARVYVAPKNSGAAGTAQAVKREREVTKRQEQLHAQVRELKAEIRSLRTSLVESAREMTALRHQAEEKQRRHDFPPIELSDAETRDLAVENALLRSRLETQSEANDQLRTRLRAEMEAGTILRNMLRRHGG